MTPTDEDLLALADRLEAPAYWLSGSDEGHEGENAAPREAAAALRVIVAERQATRDRALDDAARAASDRAAYWWDEATAADYAGRQKLSLSYEAKALACIETAAAIRAMKGKPQMTPAERIAALSLPLPDDEYSITTHGTFDPWRAFGMYGTYSSEFDDMAIDVLEELREGVKRRTDLGAEMFREMLCMADLCEYGTSPRVCFPTREFSAALPDLIDRWKAFSKLQWGDEQ